MAYIMHSTPPAKYCTIYLNWGKVYNILQLGLHP